MKTFIYKTRIYFKDTDAGGIVYHGNYLYLCEQARTHWQLEIDPDYSNQKMMENGEVFVVCGAELKYMRPIKLDDEIEIVCNVLSLDAASGTFRQEFRKDGQTKAIVIIRVTIVNTQTGRPCRFPAEMKAKYSQYMYEEKK